MLRRDRSKVAERGTPPVVSALALVVLAVPSMVLGDGRVALVAGKRTYAHMGRLPNRKTTPGHVGGILGLGF